MGKIFIGLTKDVISRAAFGTKDGGGASISKNIDFQSLFKDFLELLSGIRVGDLIPWLSWLNWIDGWTARVNRVANEFDEFLEEVIKQHLHQRTVHENGGHTTTTYDNINGDKAKDFVDVLLDHQKDSPLDFPFERESIKALILDMFAGGTDTTYTVLEWAMSELLKQPIILQRLQKEIRGIVGEKSYVDEEDLEKMHYLKIVMKETLRLHPPVPFLVRLSMEDTIVSGYEIPAGVYVMINIWAIQRDATFWEDPDTFNPDRFMGSSIDFRGQDFELLPFGSGRRMCPGISFAMTNNELVLANLLHKFDWVLPDGVKAETLDMSECIGVTIHRKTPLLSIPKVASRDKFM